MRTPQHALLLLPWLADLDIPDMELLRVLAGEDAAKGARLLLMRRYARHVGLALRHIGRTAGPNERRLEFARWEYRRGFRAEW
ncbi:MAG TPA: hypothetical protein VIU62_13275 [Chloroflexota bacterium]|jgi:hypothetical protein